MVYYKTEYLRLTYEHTLVPINGEDMWEQAAGVDVSPPVFPTKKKGSLQFKRRLEPGETSAKQLGKVGKHGVKMHCSNCGGEGHNKKTCSERQPKLKVCGCIPKCFVVSYVDASDNAFLSALLSHKSNSFDCFRLEGQEKPPPQKHPRVILRRKPLPLSPDLLQSSPPLILLSLHLQLSPLLLLSPHLQLSPLLLLSPHHHLSLHLLLNLHHLRPHLPLSSHLNVSQQHHMGPHLLLKEL